jgi:hypothetical protein
MNYRDLQNISNLSQEILIEGANEEHNVLNRWPYTSPYLQESTELDEEKRPFPFEKVEAKKEKVKKGSLYARDKGDSSPVSDSEMEATRKFNKMSVVSAAETRKKTQKEQTDLYDIILSHLLDEGYAETPEQAEVIMVNMSEDWKNSILG